MQIHMMRKRLLYLCYLKYFFENPKLIFFFQFPVGVIGASTVFIYIYLSYKVYRYKAKLRAKNIKQEDLASALRETTGLIASNVHHLQTLQDSSHKKTVLVNNIKRYNTMKKLDIGDKPKSSASHGKILIFVYQLYLELSNIIGFIYNPNCLCNFRPLPYFVLWTELRGTFWLRNWNQGK